MPQNIRNPYSFRTVNNFLHDTSTGLWFASVIMLFVLRREVSGWSVALAQPGTETFTAIQSTQLTVWWILLIALIGLAITGGIRTAYWRQENPPEAIEHARKLLIGKHIAFLIVYGIGTWWAWTLLI